MPAGWYETRADATKQLRYLKRVAKKIGDKKKWKITKETRYKIEQ